MLPFALALLNGCATTQPVGIEYCQHSNVIRWQSQAELDATPTPIVRQIVRNNETVAALCKQK